VVGRDSEDFFFCTQNGKPYSNFTQSAIRICKKSGVQRGNGLLFRHYFASSFISAVANLMELKQYMGHSSIQTTEKSYGAWLPGKRSSVHDVDFGMKR
jgi:integrase